MPFFGKKKKPPKWAEEHPKGSIAAKGGKGMTRAMSRRAAEMNARVKVLRDRLGENASAKIKGGHMSRYWTDPKSGETHVLMDTTGMKVTPTKLPKRSHDKAKGN